MHKQRGLRKTRDRERKATDEESSENEEKDLEEGLEKDAEEVEETSEEESDTKEIPKTTSRKEVLDKEEAIIKVFVTSHDPDYDCPWQSLGIEHGTGSGVVIPGGLILTVAHLTANQTFVQVQKASIPDKQRARVVFVSHECDLALLEPEDPSFFDGIEPMELGELPDLRDKVYVCGFPIGGDELSISEGVVNRIEVQRYHHSGCALLAITVDAVINSGSSGGPTIKDGKIVGIAFQGMNNVDNCGEIVPTTVIQHFLQGTKLAKEKGLKYEGFPSLGIHFQKLENPLLRKSLGMVQGESGILVRQIGFQSSSWGYLKEGDVITEIDGTKVGNNGTCSVLLNPRSDHHYRTLFTILLHAHFVGDILHIKIRRKGEVITIDLPLCAPIYLVNGHCYDEQPSYFIYCGLVFQPLSLDFLETWNKYKLRAPKILVHLFDHGMPSTEQQEIVLLSKILAADVNVGYEHNLTNTIVETVNGHPISTLRQLVDIVRQTRPDQDTVTFTTADKSIVVLPAPHLATAANEEICKVYHIASLCSQDLQNL